MTNDYQYKDLLINGHDNSIKVEYPENGKITENSIYSESFELEQSICDNEQLTFGQCNPCSVKLKFENKFPNLTGEWIKISVTPNGADKPYVFGKYKVDTDEVSDDREYREITAYDVLFDVRNMDVTEWYNGLALPRRVKRIRNSFFEYLNDKGLEITQEEVELPNDEGLVKKNSQKSQVYGGDIIEDICRVNGCFGLVDNKGMFHYVFLPTATGDDSNITIDKNNYVGQTLKYEDYTTQKITGIWFKQPSLNEDYKYEFSLSGKENPYTTEMNVFQFKKKDLESICENLLAVIKDIKYTPYSVTAKGNPLRQCGEMVKVAKTAGGMITSYILHKKLSGIQLFMDEIEANGVYLYSDDRATSSRATDYMNGRLDEVSQDSFYAYTLTNSLEVKAGNSSFVRLIRYDIVSNSDTDVILMATIPIVADRDGYVNVQYNYNNVVLTERSVRHYINRGDNVLTVANYFPVPENKNVHLSLEVKTEYVESDIRKLLANMEGSAIDTTPPRITVRKEGVRSVLFSRGLSSGEAAWDGNIEISEEFAPITVTPTENSIAITNFTEQTNIKKQTPIAKAFEAQFSAIKIIPAESAITIVPMQETLTFKNKTLAQYVEPSDIGTMAGTEFIDTSEGRFEIKTEYSYIGQEEQIDEGRLMEMQIPFGDFEVIESVVID